MIERHGGLKRTGRSGTFNRFTRGSLIAVLAAPLIVVPVALGAGQPAGATTGMIVNTKFEIDGNPQVANPPTTGDWLSTVADYPSLLNRTVVAAPTEPCGGGSDPTRFIPGTKLDQVNVNNAAPLIQSGNVNKKSDICSVRRASELVLVGGQYHFISYLAWSRVTTNGEINVLIPLLGTNPNSQTDDIIVNYDYVDSSSTTTLSFLKWNGTTWVNNTLPTNVYNAFTSTGVTDPAVPAPEGTNLTFGEYAIDLTAAGLLPENGPCATFSNGALATRTGNSPSATLEDAVALPPMNVTNCGNLTVNKVTRPATPVPAASFDFQVKQLDTAIIQAPNVTQLQRTLTVPGTPTTTITGLNISPDYVVTELTPVGGWTQESLICMAFNPITGLTTPVTLVAAGVPVVGASFPIAPGATASCTITNVGPPSMTLTKLVDPPSATGWQFQFTISPATGVTPSAAQVVTDTAPTVTWSNLTNGQLYTVTETAVAPGYQAGAISCNGGGSTFTAVAGEAVSCTATNQQLASITVVKDAAPADDTPFDFSATGVGALGTSFVLTDPAASSTTFSNVVPGQTHTIVETLTAQQITDGWKAVSVACTDALDSTTVEGTVSTTGGTVGVPSKPGSDITCVFSNAQGGSITIEKAANPVGTEQTFPFTVTGPAGAVLPAPPILLDVNNDPTNPATTTIGNLPPGDYTVSEATPGGWLLTDFSCALSGDGPIGTPDPATGAVTFTITEGQSVVCSYLNTQLATVDVTKTVEGAADWTFDFTISPDPDGAGGQDATQTATDEDPTVGWTGLDPSVEYTINEEPAPGFINGAVSCGEGGGTFTPAPGEAVACQVNNIRLASVDVTKTVQGAADWSFNFTINPVPAGQPVTQPATDEDPTVSWTDLVPGTAYTITETTDAGFITGTMTCTGGTNGVGTSTFTPAPGQNVICALTNTKLASVDVTKTVQGAADWSFNFTIDPDPDGDAGQPATQAATDEDPTVGWTGLDPSVAYTITETAVPGFISGVVSCNGDGNTFTPAAGQVVACTATNNKLATITVQKTTVGGFGGPFTLRLAGPTEGSSINRDAPISTVAANTPVAAPAYTDLQAGTYTFSELSLASGFQTGAGNYLSCTVTSSAGTPQPPVTGTGSISFTVAFGETAICTATNDKIATGQLTKTSVGGIGTFSFNVAYPGGTANGVTVSTSVAGTPSTVDLLTAINAVVTPDLPNLPFGPYTITENPLAGWFTDQTIECTVTQPDQNVRNSTNGFTLNAGESVACVASNDKTPVGTVSKLSLGGVGTFNFVVSGTGNASGYNQVVPVTTSGTPDGTGLASLPGPLPLGSYTIIEQNPSAIGFTQIGSVSCTVTHTNATTTVSTNGFSLEAGDSVACAATNINTTYRVLGNETSVNLAGTAHTFTFTVQVDRHDGLGFVNAGAGILVNFTATPAPASVSPSPCTTNASGECIVTVNNPTAGSTVITATTIGIPGVTDGLGGTQTFAIDTTDTSQTKTWIDYTLALSPLSAGNVFPTQPTHTITVQLSSLPNATAAPIAGQTVNLALTSTVATITASSGGTIAANGLTATCVTDVNGRCAVTLTATGSGSATLNASYLAAGSAPADTKVVTAAPATKTWSAFRVRVTPGTATNIVGHGHTVQVFVETTNDNGATWTGVAGVNPAVVITPVGTILSSDLCASAGTDAAGMCTVTFNSTTPDTYTITATYNLLVAGAPVPITGAATKIYVDYRISITPTAATNLVNTSHVFTVLVEKNSGDDLGFQPLVGVNPTVTKTGAGTVTTNTCASAGTSATGQCTVALTSAATGTTTLTAAYQGTADASQIKDVTANATKTWVDYQIRVAPSATNIVGNAHVFTVTVTKDSGDGAGFVALAGAVPTLTFGPTGSITAQTCSAGTNASGLCTVTVTSPAAGQGTLTATYVGTAPGTGQTPETRTYVASATKTWIDYGISVTPLSATNLVNSAHVFTVTVIKDSGDGNGFQPLAGVSPTVTISNGTITVNNCAPAPAVTDATGQCTVTVNSDTAIAATITATYTGTAPGTAEAPQTKTVTDTATKTWIDYELVLTPGADINQFPLLDQRTHDITATLTGFPNSTAAPVAGQTLTLTLVSNVSTITAVTPGGVIAGDGKSTTCVTNAAGQCVITLTATGPGIALVQGSFDSGVVGGISRTFTSNVARKAWVSYAVSVTPLTATNVVGFSHTVTVLTQMFDGEALVPMAGETPVVTIMPTGGGAAISPTADTCQTTGTDADGTCTVTFVTGTPGTYDITALLNVLVTVGEGQITIPVSSSASKTYADFQIAMSADSTNPVGSPHTFTVTVKQDSGNGQGFLPLAGAVPAISTSAFSGTLTDGCASGTDAQGQCTVTVNSNNPESVTVTAAYTGAIGEQTKVVTASATKTWVDFQIAMSADSTNPVGSPHTFTVTVKQDSGNGQGFLPLAGAVPAISTSAFSGTLTDGCASGTDAQGQCTVTVNSNNPESVTVTAAYTGAIGEQTKVVTASATKTWVVTNISVSKVANTSVLNIAADQTTPATLTWTVTVTNTTSIPAENVKSVDTLPAGWTFSSYNGNGHFTCSASGPTVTCDATPSTLPGNATSSFTITATVPAAALLDQSTVVNRVQVSTSTGETTLTDNASSSSTSVRKPPIVVVLPPTGGDPWRPLWFGSILSLAGIGFWLTSRRRRAAA